jgi:cytochrome c oxidase cbb3-type subunit 3
MNSSFSRFFVAGSAAATLLAAPALFAGQAAESGATIFVRQCAACHGKTGAGDTVMGKQFKIPDLRSAEVQKMSDSQLFDVIAKGMKGKNGGSMPAYENNLGHDKIHSVLAYIRELAKSK